MKTIELKERDEDRMRDLNARNGYGLTLTAFRALAKKHCAARKAGDEYQMALIEYRLTDINYHAYCGLLEKGQYDEALSIEWD